MGRLALFLSSLLGACGSALGLTPEIGRDLPATYAEGEVVFNQRIRQRFPLGSSEASMVSELQRQGFRRLPAYGDFEDMTFTRSEVVTETLWSVRWRARETRITEIWGIYGVTAP